MGSMFKAKSSTTKTSSETNPWAPAQGDLKNVLSEMSNWYNTAKDTGYISSTGDLGSIYSQYLTGLNGLTDQAQQGVGDLLNNSINGQSNAMQGYNNIANGSLNYSTSDILNGAKSLYNNDMVDAQIAAANKGIDQTLTEQTFTGIDRDAVGSGNMGSSRAGVAQALAAREAADMKTSNANTITANAYQNALNQSANALANNVNTQLAGYSGATNAANNLYNYAGNYVNTLMSGLNPTLTGATLNQDIQAAKQADLIGNRDYIANLLSTYYTPTATAVGGMGSSTTGKQTQPGTSMFQSILSGAGAGASLMGGLGWKPFG